MYNVREIITKYGRFKVIMAAEQDFKIPEVEERDELVLAPTVTELWTPGSITAAAERGAKVAQLVLGIDKKWAVNEFTGQLEAMNLTEVPEAVVPVVSVMLGTRDKDGTMWTPSHVVTGHDQLTMKDGQDIPETSVWGEMFANRPAAWWNKTRPEGESQLVKGPLRLLLADTALRGTTEDWASQQTKLQKLVDGHRSETTTLEGMTPLDWTMMDADAIIGDIQRPDTQTFTRFVQHEQDRSGAHGACGPSANVDGGQAYLGGSRGNPCGDVGFRAVMGQKQAS